jgi:hypothetical protein
MAPIQVAHLTLSVLLLFSGVSLLAGLQYQQPGLVGIAVVSGWFLCIVAIVAAFAVVGYLIVEAFRGRGRSALRISWLGIANGVGAVLAFWWIGSGAI